ncbi:MAG: cytochrome signal peptide protein [Pseudomonadota bacterium]
MKVKSTLAIAAIATLVMSAGVLAAGGHAEKRESLMKQNGAAMGLISKMAKGEVPFDAEKVKTALQTFSDVGKAFPAEFPVGSENDTKTASPKIWENMDDFKAKSAKLSADAEAALAALPMDVAALGPVVGIIGGNCGACHKEYKLKE